MTPRHRRPGPGRRGGSRRSPATASRYYGSWPTCSCPSTSSGCRGTPRPRSLDPSSTTLRSPAPAVPHSGAWVGRHPLGPGLAVMRRWLSAATRPRLGHPVRTASGRYRQSTAGDHDRLGHCSSSCCPRSGGAGATQPEPPPADPANDPDRGGRHLLPRAYAKVRFAAGNGQQRHDALACCDAARLGLVRRAPERARAPALSAGRFLAPLLLIDGREPLRITSPTSSTGTSPDRPGLQHVVAMRRSCRSSGSPPSRPVEARCDSVERRSRHPPLRGVRSAVMNLPSCSRQPMWPSRPLAPEGDAAPALEPKWAGSLHRFPRR